jgi:hypothetical protein
MRFDKKQLTLAVAGVLTAGVAGAAVDMDTGAGAPINYASEITTTALTLPLVATSNANTTLGVAFTGASTAFTRLDLGNSAKFGNVPVMAVAENCTFGSISFAGIVPATVTAVINNLTISFSYSTTVAGPVAAAGVVGAGAVSTSAGTAGVGATFALFALPLEANTGSFSVAAANVTISTAGGVLAAVPVTFSGITCAFASSAAVTIAPGTALTAAGALTVPSKAAPVTLTYGLYLNGAAAQGASGAVKQVGVNYLNFPQIAALQATTALVTADAAATTPFAKFAGNQTTAIIGTFVIGPPVAGAIYGAGGTAIAAGDVVTSITSPQIVISGDFSARGSLKFGGCAGAAVGTINDTAAQNSFVAGNQVVCYSVNGTTPIANSTYTVAFNPTAATGYTVASQTTTLGEIRRNGIVLVAPLVQVPAAAVATRLVLNNTGTTSQTATVTALAADGSTVTLAAGLSSITLPPGQTTVVDLIDSAGAPLFTVSGTQKRTGLRVVIPAPANSVQGYYMFLNGNNGTISNFNLQNGT